MAVPVLEVERLTVRFGRMVVLRDLSFTVQTGDALAIIGPNGSGKTVLFKALIGALPYDGAIRWAPGTRIGYVPQKLDIERDLPVTGLDFLHAKADVLGTPRHDAARVLELVNLSPALARQRIGALSGGQFQRLLVAFALLGDPTVLLFDEPTAGVDEPGEETLYAMIRRLHETAGLTLLLISHELNLVYRYATAVLCLGRQGGSCYGPPVDVLTPARLQEMYGAPMRFHNHHNAFDVDR